jgi:hypothetical protein
MGEVVHLRTYRIVEVDSLPEDKAKHFFMPWLVIFPDGYIAGVPDREAALSLARNLSSNLRRA